MSLDFLHFFYLVQSLNKKAQGMGATSENIKISRRRTFKKSRVCGWCRPTLIKTDQGIFLALDLFL